MFQNLFWKLSIRFQSIFHQPTVYLVQSGKSQRKRYLYIGEGGGIKFQEAIEKHLSDSYCLVLVLIGFEWWDIRFIDIVDYLRSRREGDFCLAIQLQMMITLKGGEGKILTKETLKEGITFSNVSHNGLVVYDTQSYSWLSFEEQQCRWGKDSSDKCFFSKKNSITTMMKSLYL